MLDLGFMMKRHEDGTVVMVSKKPMIGTVCSDCGRDAVTVITCAEVDEEIRLCMKHTITTEQRLKIELF